MRAFLIDFENVKSAGLAGIEDLAPDDHVVILYSVNSNTISFEMHQKILQSKTPIEYFQIRRGGKNSLDFQLSSLLGWLLAGGKYSHLFIISNDNGFDALTDFWTSGFVTTDAVVRRYHTIGQAVNSCKRAERVRPEIREMSAEEISAKETEPAAPVTAPEINPAIRETVREQNAQFMKSFGLGDEPAEETPAAEISAPEAPVVEAAAGEHPVVEAPAAEASASEEPEINVINVIDLFSMPSSPKKRKAVPRPVSRSERRHAEKEEPVKEEPVLPAEPVVLSEEPAEEIPVEAPVEEPVQAASPAEEAAPAAETSVVEPAPRKERPSRKKKAPRKDKPAPKKEEKPAEEAAPAEASADEKVLKIAAALPVALSELTADVQKIAGDVVTSKGKQDFYREIIRQYGQKKGLEIYKIVKSEYSNLKKLADSQ